MKPIRDFSAEEIEELTDDEIIEFVADDIQSSRASGADLEEEHVALAPWLAKATKALWREEKAWRAAQEASARKFRRYENVGSSFFGPAPQPAAESSASARKAIIAKFAQDNQVELAARRKSEEKPGEEPEEEPTREERFQFDKEVTTPTLSKATPMDNAKTFARHRLYKNGALATHRFREDWWQWNGRFYEAAPEERISAMVLPYLDQARDGSGDRFKPKPDHATELMRCLKANIAIDDRDDPPCWLPRTPAELVKQDAGSLLVFRNCLVNVTTGEVVGLTPYLWVHGGVDFDFDENAECPRWEQFLEEIFPDDPKAQMTIEEQLGYGMTTDNQFEKGAVWIGKLRSGKSTLAWVQEKLCGTDACVSLSFHDWTKGENSHENIVRRKVGIFSDVRLKPGKWYGQNYDPGGLDYSSKQLILKIIGRDKISVKRKWIGPWEGLLFIKLILTSNEVLDLQDPVLVTRFIYLHFAQSFLGREDVNLRDKLKRELPGIANRCLAAYRRLLDRGSFIQPASGRALIREVEEKISPYAAFMNQSFVEDPEGQVTCPGFYALFKDWCEANRQGHLLQSITGANQLIREVNKIERWAELKSIQPGGKRVYPGIAKKEA